MGGQKEELDTIRASFLTKLDEMQTLKSAGTVGSELKEKKMEISTLFIQLRHANRLIMLEEDKYKVETETAKMPVDQTTLQLHNLLYEKNHYLKEIRSCRDFKSKYPDIDLVSVDDFFRLAPADRKSDPSLLTDPHKLMLERLNFELLQRKELCRQRQELEVRKKALIENISARKKFLASLPSQLKGLKRASVSLQTQLGVHHKKRLKQNRLAELLPPPLYVIYSQLIAYRDAFADSIEAEIFGSNKEAEALMRLQASREVGLHLIPAVTTTTAAGGGAVGAAGGGGGGGGAEDDAMEGEEGVNHHKRVAKGKETLMAANAEQVYRAYPLTVVLNIFEETTEGGKEEIRDKQKKLVGVVFEYLPRLKVVCAAVAPGEGEGEEKNLLGNLFPDDTGDDTPNQATKLYLDGTFTFDPSRPSRPYKWAQHLAGMDFLPIVPPSLLPDEKAGTGSAVRGVNGEVLLAGFSAYREQHRVHNVIQQLRARKRAQQALKTQLEYLNKGTLPPSPVDESALQSLNRCTLRTSLRSWEEVKDAGALLEWESVELMGPGLSQSLASADGRLLQKVRLWKMVLGDEGSARERATELPSRGGGGGSLLGAGPLLPDPPGHGSSRGVGNLNISVMNAVFGATGLGTKEFDRGYPHHRKLTEHNLRPRVDWSAAGASESPPVLSAVSASAEKSRHDLGFDLDADVHVGEADCMEVDTVEAKGTENVEEKEEDPVSQRIWQGFGMRVFKARLQRDLGHGHGPLTLEAKVFMTPEYPLRPPVFRLQMAGNLQQCGPPLPPPGVALSEVQCPAGERAMFMSNNSSLYNELRWMETEVNLHCWRKIPEQRRDHLLALQIGVLVNMFDFLVDSLQTLSWKKGPPVFLGHGGASRPAQPALAESSLRRPLGLRLLRGRDRRTPVSPNEFSDVTVAI